MSMLSSGLSERSSTRHDENTKSQNVTRSTFQLPPTASRLLGMAQSRATRDTVSQSLMSLERRSRELEELFQEYLDAQSRGLLATIGGELGKDDPVGSVSSVTIGHEEVSTSSGRTTLVRQPARRQLSLREARQKLWRTMQELSKVKTEELEHLDAALRPIQTAMGQIDSWQSKRKRLDEQITSIQREGPKSRLEELNLEDQALSDQINAMELKLTELRSQKRAVHLEQTRLQNNVQSQMSSFEGSKSILEKEIQQFLQQPPRTIVRFSQSKTPFLSLPKDRRTLAMARDHLAEQDEALLLRLGSVNDERKALGEGAKVWRDSASVVIGFETALAQEMKQLGLKATTKAVVNPNEPNSEAKEAKDGMNSLIERMKKVIDQLESSLGLAESRGWNLLICCIGAELEALRQGREILGNALGLIDKDISGIPPEDALLEGEALQQEPGNEEQAQPDLQEEPSPVAEFRRQQREEDPESLLLSGQDGDSE